MKKKIILCFAFVIIFSSNSFALILGFENITSNNIADAVTGETQLFLEVTEYNFNSQILFEFYNVGPLPSSIADIYFDDNAQLLINYYTYSLIESPGVSFDYTATPSHLPGSSFTAEYSYDSNSPIQHNGINPGESLGIVFDYSIGTTFSDIETALSMGTLVSGIHVQGFDGEGSESFITSVNPVPEPGALMLFGTGLLCLGWVGRRIKNN